MRPSTIWFILKQGFKNIKRNWMFSLASILTMSACIFLFGVFYSIVNNVNHLAHKLEEEVPITVFFDEGTTQEEIDGIGELLSQRPEVARLEFESGDEAWESFKEMYFEGSDAADAFKDDNPLVNSANYRVYMKNIEEQGQLVAYVESLEHVREVRKSEEAARTLGNVNRLISIVSLVVIAILLVISVVLISNTVSVGISVRSEEIGIMKLIGATDGFVRSPFVLEGILLGILGSAIPLAILYFAYSRSVSYVLAKFNVLAGVVDFIPVETIYLTLLPVGIALGIGIGLLGSLWTTKKHLKV